MRVSPTLLHAAKKSATPRVQLPVEMYPLFAAVGVAIGSGAYFTYRHFAYDRELRLWKNADLSNLDLILNEAQKKESENKSEE